MDSKDSGTMRSRAARLMLYKVFPTTPKSVAADSSTTLPVRR